MLLLRRLLVLVNVTVVPFFTPYQSLMYVATLQLSALAQHRYVPFRSAVDNGCELASLYLHSLNFLTALLQSVSRSPLTLQPLFVSLLAGNILFVAFVAGRVLLLAVRSLRGEGGLKDASTVADGDRDVPLLGRESN